MREKEEERQFGHLEKTTEKNLMKANNSINNNNNICVCRKTSRKENKKKNRCSTELLYDDGMW